jgi:hypothetical protein
MGFRSFGFPPACHPSYGASDCYPDRTSSYGTHQPFLDTQLIGTVSVSISSPVGDIHSVELSAQKGPTLSA